jgi:hypothetical protein
MKVSVLARKVNTGRISKERAFEGDSMGPAFVVDGICGSGKSTILRTLQSVLGDDWPNFSKLHISEHLTERFFERVQPTQAAVHDHVARVLRIVCEVQAIHRSSIYATDVRATTITIERLFLTFASRKLLTDRFFREHTDLLSALELKSVLLIVPSELITDRIAETIRHRNQGWSDYIARLGGLSGAVEYFRQQQDAMLRANDMLAVHIPSQTLTVAHPEELTGRELVRRVFLADIRA